ncbi:hypothetical protein HY487_01610 [Candidatus Woesearchaeota archaeon]|nr:hypothetical protein [Candidatus Woesearchaeota archaeon]
MGAKDLVLLSGVRNYFRNLRMYATAVNAVRAAAQDIDPITDLSDRMDQAKRGLQEREIPYIEASVETPSHGQLHHKNDSRSPMFGHEVLVVGGKVQDGHIIGGRVIDLLCQGPIPTERYPSQAYRNAPGSLFLRVQNVYNER